VPEIPLLHHLSPYRRAKGSVCTRYLLQIPMVLRIVSRDGDNTSHCTWDESTVYKNCGETFTRPR